MKDLIMNPQPILFCGDPHGRFDHILRAAELLDPTAIVLLGDIEPIQPLHLELAAIDPNKLWFIHGNHDTDSDQNWHHLWGSTLAERNLHGRVVELPNGLKLAGLGGVFRESVWYPGQSEARFESRSSHTRSTPRQDRWQGGVHRKHWSSIYPDEVNRLADQHADILVTHEAPGYHPHGFEILDDLARCMGVKVSVHGHQHDRLDSSHCWVQQGFRSFGVGLCGITAIDMEDHAEVIVSGDLDHQRHSRGA
jgi:predicted phosphodiesterase